MSATTQRLAAAILTAMTLNLASRADACQNPPDPPGGELPCRIMPETPVVTKSDPFNFQVSFTNFPITAPFPPPFRDDMPFDIAVTSGRGFSDPCSGLGPGIGGVVNLDPASYSVELDEAWSPFADEPTSDSTDVVATPTTVGDFYRVFAFVCGGGSAPTGCDRWCNVQLCVDAFDDPMSQSGPYAEFVQPETYAAAGDTVPLQLRVLRNNYPPGVPLTVKVEPENWSDAIDIFPLDPPEIETGIDVTTDDEVITFSCGMHFPCFVGVDNHYHVTISDGATVLWDSKRAFYGGIGRVVVNRSPMARQELVEIRDAGADGALEVGEEGEIHLRLYARNPYFESSLMGAVLSTEIPTGLTVKSWDLHFHDNPMDTYTPTPLELAAVGTVTQPPGMFQVDITELVARFVDENWLPPPAVFFDLFEVELVLETPPGGFGSPVILDFPGVDVTGTASGIAKAETSPSLQIEVTGSAELPPHPTAIYLTKAGSDARINWPDSVVDAAHDGASSYIVYRSEILPDSGYTELVTVIDTAASMEEALDSGALPGAAGTLYFYRLSAFNGGGHSGDIPN